MQTALTFSSTAHSIPPNSLSFSRRRKMHLTVNNALTAESISITSTSSPSSSLYHILKINHQASTKEIKKAYRNLAKKYHPDTAICQEQVDRDGIDFIEIHNAYATLSDPVARALYDLSLSSDRRSTTAVGYYSTRRWETDQCW